MWRFAKNNGITEGFHNLPAALRAAMSAGKMEMILELERRLACQAVVLERLITVRLRHPRRLGWATA